jgi:hypothetical protein
MLNGADLRSPPAEGLQGLNRSNLRVIYDEVVTSHFFTALTLSSSRPLGITMCPAPRGRVLTHDASEHFRQMRLVTQAAAVCNLVEVEIGAKHHALRQFNAPAPEESSGRNPERLLERAAEMARAQTCKSRQPSYRNSSGELRIDVSRDSPRTPRRQPRSNPRSSVLGLEYAGSRRPDSAWL